MSKDTYWDSYMIGSLLKRWQLFLASPNEPRTFHETPYIIDRQPSWAKWVRELGPYVVWDTGHFREDGGWMKVGQFKLLAQAKAEAEKRAKEEA